jgi:hypothetical protein
MGERDLVAVTWTSFRLVNTKRERIIALSSLPQITFDPQPSVDDGSVGAFRHRDARDSESSVLSMVPSINADGEETCRSSQDQVARLSTQSLNIAAVALSSAQWLYPLHTALKPNTPRGLVGGPTSVRVTAPPSLCSRTSHVRVGPP